MIAIFVAKDAGEFSRYCEGLKEACREYGIESSRIPICKSEDSKGCVAWKLRDLDDVGLVIKMRDSEKMVMRNNLSSSEVMKHAGNFLKDLSDQIQSMLKSISDDCDSIKNVLENPSVAHEVVISNEVQSIKTGDQRPSSRPQNKKGESSVVSISCDVRLFVHWGGGSPLDYERQFQEAYMKDLHSVDDNKYASKTFPNLRAFALSSRRREFDVMGSTIKVPIKHEELENIVQRFTLARIRDFLTQYVIAVSLGKEPAIEVSGDKCAEVKENLKWIKGKYETSLVMSEEERKLRIAALEVAIGDPLCNTEGIRQKIAHTYSRIIEEGM